MRCTVPTATPNRAATLRTPSVRPGLRSHLILPKMFEPVGRQRGVAHRQGNAAVAEIVLDGSGVLAVIGQLVSAAMTQHVAMNEKPNPADSPARATMR